ncbi:reverse transcriptase (RNA-dependent DNA polymerase) [Prevotella sp. CAG:755]|nr:reverse transcriptase (RNA-dependent DNA polymerase) [Prevotella sp. CAG:755]
MIAERAAQMKTRADLLLLLNDIRHDELAEAGREEDYHPFTQPKFNFYINPNHTQGRYREFYIPKRSGGRRRISAPRTGTYKYMLHALNLLLGSLYTPSLSAMGFAPGRSIVTGAEKHVGQHYVFNTDLRDFFPSVRRARVKARLLLPPFGFTEEVAIAVAGLCTVRVEAPGDDGQPARPIYVLPQGAPTSPLLTNAVCDRLDRRLTGLARRCGANYTRYADDITFSSPHNLCVEGSAFRAELARILAVEGFEMNEAKTRVQRSGQRQEVTGLVVNRRVNVCRHYVRSLRAVLYVWRRYGYDAALAALLRHDRVVPERRGRRRLPDLTRVIEGRLLFVRQVRGTADPLYARLQAAFDALVASMSAQKCENGLTFIWTVPLEQFEKQYGATVKIHFFPAEPTSQPTSSDSAAETNAPSADAQSAPTAMASCRFTLPRNRAKGGDTYDAQVELPLTVSRRLTPQTPREGMAVSFCRATKGIPFLLLHRQGAVTVAIITGSGMAGGSQPAGNAPGIFATLPVYGKRRLASAVQADQGEPPVDVDALLAELENYLTDHNG